MFKGMAFYFHPAKLSKTRLKLFETQVEKNRGSVVMRIELATIVIVDEGCDKLNLPTSLWDKTCLGSLWISNCLKEKRVVDQNPFIVGKPCLKRTSSIDEPTIVGNQQTAALLNRPNVKVPKYACSQVSTAKNDACNTIVLCQLQKLAETYRARGDQWRAHGYDKAISAIRRYGKEITKYEEVVHLEGVGPKMACKIKEIISTGSLRKVTELCETEQSEMLKIFSNIWGAGPSAANAWYLKGHRSLKDLIEKESLTKQQQIGIQYYEEFLKRMTRKEVEEIGKKVDIAALEVDSSLKTMLCGSYRRGKETCGDVDVVVIKPDRLLAKEILTAILAKLKESGFITNDLVSLERNGNQRKYLGVCKLPGENQLHRRLDIFVVPVSESACAIMHYTGSALFNRSIRALAIEKNMHLSEHSLRAGVVRQGSEIQNCGFILPTPTENTIFDHLELEYRPPQERDH